MRNLMFALLGACCAMAAITAFAQVTRHPLMLGWPGYDAPELYPRYADKHGHLFRFQAWRDEDQGIRRVQQGDAVDLVLACSYRLGDWYATGRIAPLDTTRIANWDDILPSLKRLDTALRDGPPRWVPIEWGQASIVFRTDLAPEYVENETWSILLDEKYAGRLATFERGIDMGVVAGLLAGVPDIWDHADSEALAKTKATLQQITDQARFASNDAASIERALTSGDIVAATAWNQSLMRLEQQRLPVKFMNPREGAVTWVCGLSVVQDTPHLDKAYDVINAMLSRESRMWAIEEFGFGASTREPFAATDARVLAARGLSKDPQAQLDSGTFHSGIADPAAFDELFRGTPTRF